MEIQRSEYVLIAGSRDASGRALSRSTIGIICTLYIDDLNEGGRFARDDKEQKMLLLSQEMPEKH